MPFAVEFFLDTNNFPVASPLTIVDALTQAYAHWNAGQAPQAEQLCLRVLAVAPHQPDALHLLGLMAHAYGLQDQALNYLRKACLALDASAHCYSNFAEVCRVQGLLEEGEAAARRAVAMAPTLLAGWNNLGIILQERGDLQAGLECLQRMVELEPDNPEAHNNLANTYKRMGRLDQAQTHYQRALALHPNYAQAHSNLALLLNEQGRHEDAYAAAQLAIELEPQLAGAYLNLAEIERSRQRFGEALHWLEALLSFAPDHGPALAARQMVAAQAAAAGPSA